MPPIVESLDPEEIAKEVLSSRERLGNAPARRRWARAIVRRIAEGQPWLPGVRRALYLAARADRRIPSDLTGAVATLLTDHRWSEAMDLARALADADVAAWRRSLEYAPTVYALRCVIDAHFRLGASPTFRTVCEIALDALEKRRIDLLRGLVVDDLLRRNEPGAKLFGAVAAVCAGGDRHKAALRHLIPGHSGFLAACVFVCVYPGAVDASTLDGWQGMLTGSVQRRLAEQGLDERADRAPAYTKHWRWLADERARSKRLREQIATQGVDMNFVAADEGELAGLLAEAQAAVVASGFKPHRVCVPKLSTTRNRDAPRSAVAGQELPVGTSTMSAILEVRRRLLLEFPWLEDVVRPLCGQLFVSAGAEVRLRPTIIVGPPGCGKSRLIRRLAELLQVPSIVIDGTHDDAGCDLVGTSARWSSAQPTAMSLAFERYRSATAVVLIDEIEKATSRRDRGHTSLHDAMLTLTEPSTAGRVPDKALGVDIDCSGITWIMTANSLEGVPDALFDRVQILRATAPGREHVSALAQSLATDIMRSRGYPPDEVEPLDDLELRLVAKTWRGGSVRQLGRIVEAMLDARASFGGLSIH